MMTVSTERGVFTVLALFTAKPEDLESYLNLFKVSIQAMWKQPGFVAASLHKSVDGTTILNYMQWRSRTEFEAYVSRQGRAEREREFRELVAEKGYAPPDRRPYEVVFVAEGPE